MVADLYRIIKVNALRKRALQRAGFLLGKPLRRLQVAQSARLVFGPVSHPMGAPCVFCCFKNASYHLRAFVEHHRSLGFDHFVFMDNGSTDNSAAILKSFQGITLFHSLAPFGTHQMEMREWMLERMGRDRWCLLLDVDEHFRWQNAHKIPLQDFTASLEKMGFNAVVAQMVDVFGKQLPAPEIAPRFASPSLEMLKLHFPFFTDEGLIVRPYLFGTALHGNKVSNPAIPCLYGGLRRKLFGTEDFLTKHPFFHYSDGLRPVVTSAHTVCNARIANFSAILLHYKLVDNFYQVVQSGLLSGSHANVRQNYQIQKRALEDNSVSLLGVRSHLVADDSALLRAGFFTAIHHGANAESSASELEYAHWPITPCL